MTNDCWNVYTIVGNTSEIQELYRNELERLTMVENPSSGHIFDITKHTEREVFVSVFGLEIHPIENGWYRCLKNIPLCG